MSFFVFIRTFSTFGATTLSEIAADFTTFPGRLTLGFGGSFGDSFLDCISIGGFLAMLGEEVDGPVFRHLLHHVPNSIHCCSDGIWCSTNGPPHYIPSLRHDLRRRSMTHVQFQYVSGSTFFSTSAHYQTHQMGRKWVKQHITIDHHFIRCDHLGNLHLQIKVLQVNTFNPSRYIGSSTNDLVTFSSSSDDEGASAFSSLADFPAFPTPLVTYVY